jgi:predicted metal-dependent HD superfamily phosphohydrolase
MAAYDEPHRRYHTREHIEACLSWLDRCWDDAARPHEIEMALFYHDPVYEPLASDNESRSAAEARRVLAGAQVPDSVIGRIEELILATYSHDAKAGDAGLLTDIDLSILGSSPNTFAGFERAIREEFAAVDDYAYALGRGAVLARLAERDPQFVTASIERELGANARQNLARACAHWKHEAGRLRVSREAANK